MSKWALWEEPNSTPSSRKQRGFSQVWSPFVKELRKGLFSLRMAHYTKMFDVFIELFSTGKYVFVIFPSSMPLSTWRKALGKEEEARGKGVIWKTTV
jgi:hypothetical protein